jgi:hypothetical protein
MGVGRAGCFGGWAGLTPRDWSATPDKLKQPFNYTVDQFDVDIGATACNMCFEKNEEISLVQVGTQNATSQL